MSRFDRLALATVLSLGLTVALLSVASARLGPAVDGSSTLQVFDGTSVYSQVGVTFTEPMDVRSVERSFRITPAVAGDFSWLGNELLFTPRKRLTYGIRYTVSISAGARDRTGKRLFRSYHTAFTTQSQHLLYLGTQGDEQGQLILASVTGRRRAVGITDGRITGFGTSSDGSLAAYVRRGAPGERADELWLVNLTDNSTQRVFRQPDWSIAQPHLSPDGRYVVFLATNVLLCRKYYGCFRDKTGPLIYLLDLRTRKASPFHSKSDVPITSFVDFSPGGQLAYTDLGSALVLADRNGQNVVHVPNQGNALEFVGFDQQGDKAAFVGQTASSTGGDILVYRGGKYLDVSRGVYDSATPSFSSSGKKVAYAAYRGERGIEPVYGINLSDLTTGRTVKLTSERAWSDWNPQWSPDDRYVGFVRSQPQEAMYMGSGEVWVVGANGEGARPLGGVGKDLRWVS